MASAFLRAGDAAGWDFISSCMASDWRLRPSAAECLQHPFLKGAALQ